MEAFDIIRILHNLMRLAVVIFGVLAAGRALTGWLGKRGWKPLDDRLGLLFTVSLDIQVLLGLILYFVLSPRTTQNFSRFGEAMGEAGTRFYLVEHFLLMLVAVALAHVGRSRAHKAPNPIARHRATAIFFVLALLLIFIGIPWQAPLLPLN